MEALIVMASGIINLFCFIIGARIGQKIIKNEKIDIPTLNPLQGIRESRSKKVAEKKQDQLEAIMRNVECYDGTPRGQKDIPKG